MEDKQRIKTPGGVRKLMEDLWKRYKNDEPFPLNNVFWVELPPLTEEEKAEIEEKKKAELKTGKEEGDSPEGSISI